MGRKDHSRCIKSVNSKGEEQHAERSFFRFKNPLMEGFPFFCQHRAFRRAFDQILPKGILHIGRAENGNEKQYALNVSQIDKMFEEGQREEKERRESDQLVVYQGFLL
jgi:hypothetical protein